MNRRNMRCRKRKEREIGIDISFARSDENGLFWHLRKIMLTTCVLDVYNNYVWDKGREHEARQKMKKRI